MKFKVGSRIDFPDHFSTMDEDTLIINFNRRMIISNAFYNGGLTFSSSIINHSLNGKKDCGGEPYKYMDSLLNRKELPRNTVALMTAVMPDKFHFTQNEYGCVYLSMGIDNASNPLDDLGYPGFGTINTIIVLKNKITQIAAIDLFKSLVELKSYFLYSHGVKSTKSGLPATGTFTDVLAIVSGSDFPEITYAGPATRLSNRLSVSLYDLMEDAIKEL